MTHIPSRSIRLLPYSVLLAAVLLSLTFCSAASKLPISVEDLKAYVSFLASDRLGGRDVGSAGIRDAEDYIAARFRDSGLTPLPGEVDFRIGFTLFRKDYDPAATLLDFGDGRIRELGEDFRPFPFSGFGNWEAGLRFAGYGITAPEYDYDDYDGLDVEGRFVLVLRHEPRENDPKSVFAGTDMTRHSLFLEKAKTARRNGAMGLLVVTDPLNHPPGDDLRTRGIFSLDPEVLSSGSSPDRLEGFPAMHISRRAATALLGSDRALADRKTAADSGEPPSNHPPGSIRIKAAIAAAGGTDAVPCRNVAGYLEGRDPELRDEIIVVGAHHDHIGFFGGVEDGIYNGADDNASGVAGVLALASALRSHPPARSVVFVTFSAEEKGLFGSEAFLDRLPADRIFCMLNLDMIGRNTERELGAVTNSVELRRILKEIGEEKELPVRFRSADRGTASDADSFQRRGIPAVFLTTGLHEDYHRVTDHADRIDYGRMVRILELCLRFVEAAAEHQID